MRYKQLLKLHSIRLLMMMSASFTIRTFLNMSLESDHISKNFFNKFSLILKSTFLRWRYLIMRRRFVITFVKFTQIFLQIIHKRSLWIGFFLVNKLKNPTKICLKYCLILIRLCSFLMTVQMSG